MDSKRIVITGANGFIGANLCHHFSSRGHELYAILRKDANMWRLDGIKENMHLIFISDFTTKSLTKMFQEIRPQVVLNTVGADQKEFLTHPEGNWNSNFMTLVKLVNSLKDLAIERFIHAGSSFEYGNVSSSNNLLSEGIECQPISEYAISKLLQSEYLKLTSSLYNFKSVILRIFNVFGPFESQNRLVPHVILNALKNEKITIFNPTISRDFIYIDDVINAFQKSIDFNGDLTHSIFNIGSGLGTSVSTIVDNVLKLTKSKSKINFVSGDNRPENSLPSPVADIALARKVLKWSPINSINDALRKDITWFTQNRADYEIF